MKNELKLVLTLMALLGLAACNTTKGLGKDVEVTGEKIQETAQDASDELSDDD
jgi:predicted small secreted protein